MRAPCLALLPFALASMQCARGENARVAEPPLEAGAGFAVRVHWFGGGPTEFNWTTTVRSSGEVMAYGGEFPRCEGATSFVSRGREDAPLRGRVPAAELAKLRALLQSRAFAEAKGSPAITAPNRDGVGAELTVMSGGASRGLKMDGFAASQISDTPAEPVVEDVVTEVRRLHELAGFGVDC